jgi:hypothetical protein
MMRIGRSERLHCPEEFTSLLGEIFGVNPFGEPNFRIVWGQTETFDAADGDGYQQRLIGLNQPCWILQRWLPPECYDTPDIYYRVTADPESGLPMLGEYPEFGRYETITPFMLKRYNPETKSLEIKTLPLDWEIIERAIPILFASEQMTEAERLAAQNQREEEENAAIVTEIAERLADSLPTFYGPTSFADQRNRTALIDRKKAEIERAWKQLGIHKRRNPKRGFYQGEPN